MTEPVTVRALGFSDLPQVIAIERRAFPTPWSLSMFVLELSKPSGVCLAAAAEPESFSGTSSARRYDDVWHLMNIAVDPAARRRGVARAMLEQMLVRAGLEQPTRSRCARRTSALSPCMSASGFVVRARAGGTTATRGRTP